jgi:hypothetical protein
MLWAEYVASNLSWESQWLDGCGEAATSLSAADPDSQPSGRGSAMSPNVDAPQWHGSSSEEVPPGELSIDTEADERLGSRDWWARDKDHLRRLGNPEGRNASAA